MTTTTHVYRSFAVEAARQQGWVGFRTLMDKNGMWKARYEPGDNPADEYARGPGAEWCTHGEVSWYGGESDPHRTWVLVARVPFDQLEQYAKVAVDRSTAKVWVYPLDRLGHNPPHPGCLCEPADAERWPIFGGPAPSQVRYDDREVLPGEQPAKRARAGGSDGAPPKSEPSKVGSPTKRVWEIADSMPGAPRKEVIGACVEAGINPSTASVQYSAWSKARAATAS